MAASFGSFDDHSRTHGAPSRKDGFSIVHLPARTSRGGRPARRNLSNSHTEGLTCSRDW